VQNLALTESSLYIQDGLEWKRGNRPGQPAPELAVGEIIALIPDGTLMLVSCYLSKTSDQRIRIAYSEGYNISAGSWRTLGKKLDVRYQPIYMNAQPPQVPPERREEWIYVPGQSSGRLATSFSTPNKRFKPLVNLVEIEGLARVIEFRRREAASR
jgi:hypothetical protein